MNEILLLHGPNLNALGRRNPEHYGSLTLSELEARVSEWGNVRGVSVRSFQSNHEGALIDMLQEAYEWASGALVNLGAFTHSSYALSDALLDFAKPVVEVHLSKISAREVWRRTSVIRSSCVASIEGLGIEGYREALDHLVKAINENN